MKILTDQQAIKEFLEKGVQEVIPSKGQVAERLKEGRRLTMYLGIDPTGPTLHIGHTTTLKKLQQFQQLGHRAVLLIGDFTAMIGDPTGKDTARTPLTKKEVQKNAKQYKEQASVFLDFDGDNPAELFYNSSWLDSLSFEDVVHLSAQFTVDQMLKRDMFVRRTEKGKPIHLHEFLYPLMQGYDSVGINTDGEVGGNDQLFNMLAGRTLMKNLKGKDKFVITTKLLIDNLGKKMGKTEGNMVSFSDLPEEMFGKVMSWDDDIIALGFELCTDVTTNELTTIQERLDGDENPRDIKRELAEKIVAVYHGEDVAQKTKEDYIKIFSKGEIPESMPNISINKEETLLEALVREGVVPSKSEWRRLVEQGAVTNLETGEKITEADFLPTQKTRLKIGKKIFIEIT